jgi:hypothetical protein
VEEQQVSSRAPVGHAAAGADRHAQIDLISTLERKTVETTSAAHIGGYFSRGHEPAARRGTDRHAMYTDR